MMSTVTDTVDVCNVVAESKPVKYCLNSASGIAF